MWAITPNAVRKEVGARRIEPGWPLTAGETFTAETWEEGMRLAADGASLREETAAERAARLKQPTELELVERRMQADPLVRRLIKRQARKEGISVQALMDQIKAEK